MERFCLFGVCVMLEAMFFGNGTPAGVVDSSVVEVDGLLAYYPLKTDSLDVVGGYDGVDTGISYDGLSASFISPGTYITLPSYTVTDANMMSVSGWFKPVTIANSRYLLNLGPNNKFIIFTYSGNYYVYIGYYSLTITGADMPLGVWTHLSMVMDNGVAYLYVNGTLFASRTTFVNADAPSTLGYTSVYAADFYAAHFRVYDKVLSATSVAKIYNAERADFGV